MSYQQTIREHLRLVILRTLSEQNDGALNASVLRSILPQFGFTVTRAQILSEAAWLEELGLVACREAGAVFVIEITERGEEVARGLARVPGIARPSRRSE